MCRHCYSRFFIFFRLKEREINIGRMDLRPGETNSRETPYYCCKNDKYSTYGRIVLSPDELPLGESTFGPNELIPIKLFCATIPPPSHTIVWVETNLSIFF